MKKIFYKDLGNQTFSKKNFIETPTRWFSFESKKDKNLFMIFKIGELKDGKTYIGVLKGKKEGKLNFQEKVMLQKDFIIFFDDLSKKMKKPLIVSEPPEDWMLNDLPKEWRENLKLKMEEGKENLRYIG